MITIDMLRISFRISFKGRDREMSLLVHSHELLSQMRAIK